jgi:IS30 family transposase
MASHLSMEERKRISDLRRNGHSHVQIARALARAKSTISREIKRNRHGCLYCPILATQKTFDRRRRRQLVRKMDRPEIAEVVKQGLKDYHSPDQIAGRMKRTISDPHNRISATTIYRWIDAQPRGTWDQYLRRFGKRRRGRKPSGMPGAARIHGRPEEAEQRAACGHWEGDTVWGSQRQGGLVTLVDRKSRFVLLIPSKDRTARRVRLKVQKLLQSLPSEQRRSVTFDKWQRVLRAQAPGRPRRNAGVLCRSLLFLAAGHQREYERTGSPVFSQRHFPSKCFHTARHARSATAQPPTAENLGYLTPSEVFTTQKTVAIEA